MVAITGRTEFSSFIISLNGILFFFTISLRNINQIVKSFVMFLVFFLYFVCIVFFFFVLSDWDCYRTFFVLTRVLNNFIIVLTFDRLKSSSV